MITSYGLGDGRVLLLMYCPFGQTLVLPYLFVDLVSETPQIGEFNILTLSRMIWHSPFVLAMSAEVPRVARICRPGLKRSKARKGLWDSKEKSPPFARFKFQYPTATL